MVKNYLIIALRFFSRQRGFSIINISGLTIGIACSLLILLYVQDELKFDRFHRDADRIYRLGFQGNIQGKLTQSTLTGFPVAEVLKEEVSEVESVQRLAAWKTFPVKYEDKLFTEPYLLLADAGFFRFFSFDLIEGHPDSVLRGNRKIVITESAARRLLNYKGRGDKSPLGKTVTLAQGYTATISGIAADPPPTSHFHFTLILSLSSWEEAEPKDWLNGKVVTYFKLRPNADIAVVEKKILERLKTKLDEHLTHLRKTNLAEYKKQGSDLSYFIQPLTSIHLYSDVEEEIETNGSIEYIYLFSSIAAFITLLACINFMNLTTAQSASRAKEVAVRKAVGAQNGRLMTQFLVESYIYVLIAMVLAFLIIVIALGPFNYFTAKQLTTSALLSFPFITGILFFIVVTGLVAGSYPAFYLTNFSPVEVLKGALRGKIRNYGIRNVLVVFQFFISAGLIIATLVVYQQIGYVKRVNLGFNKENIINLLHTKNLLSKASAFKKEVLAQPGIVSASYCNRLPPHVDWQAIFRPDSLAKDFSLAVYEMDYDHLKTMGYVMKSGRFFEAGENDTLSVILNETAARKLGVIDFKGKKLYTTYDQPSGRKRKIIGIIRDFNFQSLKQPIQPMAVVLGYEPNWEMAIRVNGNVEQHIAVIKKLYKKYAPDAPFQYSLVQNNFESQHASEQRIGMLFIFFTVLAIIIACLGLFGLATFTAQQQRKAIGIRKVLGASIVNIVTLLNKEFLKLVLIANVIAWPVAWWLMRGWLNQFAYHVNVPWWTFAASGITTFTIAFISISYKAFQAASGNPVNSLRNE
jgi:putative ABC transport system permease protein